MGQPAEDPMVAKAFDANKHDELARAIEQLSPDEAQFFLWRLEIALRKRKIQLLGYLVAMLIWLLGMVGALVIYGMSTGFVGYVFIAPFGLVGIVLYIFGWWANRISKTPRPPPAV
ncbi:MAG: hypothetical protein ACM31C_19180 [Acidobacteriota bacterium]